MAMFITMPGIMLRRLVMSNLRNHVRTHVPDDDDDADGASSAGGDVQGLREAQVQNQRQGTEAAALAAAAAAPPTAVPAPTPEGSMSAQRAPSLSKVLNMSPSLSKVLTMSKSGRLPVPKSFRFKVAFAGMMVSWAGCRPGERDRGNAQRASAQLSDRSTGPLVAKAS